MGCVLPAFRARAIQGPTPCHFPAATPPQDPFRRPLRLSSTLGCETQGRKVGWAPMGLHFPSQPSSSSFAGRLATFPSASWAPRGPSAFGLPPWWSRAQPSWAARQWPRGRERLASRGGKRGDKAAIQGHTCNAEQRCLSSERPRNGTRLHQDTPAPRGAPHAQRQRESTWLNERKAAGRWPLLRKRGFCERVPGCGDESRGFQKVARPPKKSRFCGYNRPRVSPRK